MSASDDFHRASRHEKIRRVKWFLRFVPRRANFHRYPVMGRFAGAVRRRAYLWSFKPVHLRPALYFGSILALWPLMGVQLPLALGLCVFLRANIMVAGGLQFITNPFTAAPIYYVTFKIGRKVMDSGRAVGDAIFGTDTEIMQPVEESVTIDISPVQTLPADLHWTASFASTVCALVIGGTLCGLALGLVLDILYRSGFHIKQGHKEHGARRPRPSSHRSGSAVAGRPVDPHTPHPHGRS